MRDSYTLDEVIADALHERGFTFRERDHVGLRADPPVIRLQANPKGDWVILDVDVILGTADNLVQAKAKAGRILAGPGVILILGPDGLVQGVERYSPDPVDATPHVRVRMVPAKAPAEPASKSSTAAQPEAPPVETDAAGSATQPRSTAEITAEGMRQMLGPAWTSAMDDARRRGDTEGLAEGLREGYHIVHALHPVLHELIRKLMDAARLS